VWRITDFARISNSPHKRYEYNPRGLVVIESKDDACKRGVSSPDRAEALMLAFANMTLPLVTFYEKQFRYERERELALSQGRKPPDPPENKLLKVYLESRDYYRRFREGLES